MTDRPTNYPRLIPQFSSGMSQQQQQHPQQPQQQSQSDPHTMNNADHNRVWQAAQPYRGQNAGDIAGSQGNTLMPDLQRARAMGQQGQQQQQSFVSASPQMNITGQHSVFHDHQGSQPSQPQIPPNFGITGMPNSAQLQTAMNSRTSAPGLPSSFVVRQIELMGMASNQLHQNPQIGPPTLVTRMPQQQQQQQAGMNGQNQGQSLFGSQSADLNRGSPPHPTQTPGAMPLQHGGMQFNAQGLSAGRRPMTYAELKERAIYLRNSITKKESALYILTNNRASTDQGSYASNVGQLATEIETQKELLSRVQQAMKMAVPPGLNNVNLNGSQGGNPGNMPALGPSPIAQHQQVASNGTNQSTWLSQAFQMRGSQLQNSQAVSQPPASGQIQPSNIVPQRPGSTSNQLPAQISPNLSNQSTGNQFPASQTPNLALAQFSLPPPLDKARFQESYTAFCNKWSIKYDEQLMSVDNRPVDLHALHCNVLSEGGEMKVTARDLWPVIGARMGFVQFPGTSTEHAKSGPGVAQKLQHLYQQYLRHFDRIYVHSALQKQSVPPNSTGTSHVNSLQSNNPSAGTSGGNTAAAIHAQMMNAVVHYANTSAEELRVRNIPDDIIRFVEQNRPHLQRIMQQQQQFRGMVQKPNPQGQTSESERMVPNVSGFPYVSPQQQQAIPAAGARQPPQPSHQGRFQTGINLTGSEHGQSQPQNTATHNLPSWPARPTPEQSQYFLQLIARCKQEFMVKSLPAMKQHQVPDNQRIDYSKFVDVAFRYAHDIEPKLPYYCYVLQDIEMIRKLVAIICTTREQRNLIALDPPKYILPFTMLPTLIAQMQNANAQFNSAVSAFRAQIPRTSNGQPSSNGSQQRPPVPQQAPQQIQSTPLPTQSVPAPSGSRSVNLHPPPPPKKKVQQPQLNAVVTAAAAPSPTPPASTPAAATPAATPAAAVAASPKTPKSPKGKAPAKSKVSASTKRKSSKVVPPTPEPAQPTAPSPGGGSLKRQREEEEPTETPAVSSAPSPKKAKTESEWDGPASAELVKKEQQIENIKTEEDASAFLGRMEEYIRQAAGNDQELLASNISETLDMILKGCGQDQSDISGALELRDPSSPSVPADDFQFQDFVDFTSCAADDLDSKPTTPDLVSSSSTNPSPESASDPADPSHSATGVSSDNPKPVNYKSEDADERDPFHLGGWKEIDGGQSTYYQSNEWNWDTPMVVQEQSWAVGS